MPVLEQIKSCLVLEYGHTHACFRANQVMLGPRVKIWQSVCSTHIAAMKCFQQSEVAAVGLSTLAS